MREAVQKVVDGKLYEFEQFKTTEALKVLARLTKIFGEPLTLALGAFFKDKPESFIGKLDENGLPIKVEEVQAEKKSFLDQDLGDKSDILAKAVRTLIDRLDEDEVVELVKKLASEKVKCDGAPIIFDDHYVGSPMHLFKVVAAGLEVQYGNFLNAITDQIATPKTGRTVAGIRSV